MVSQGVARSAVAEAELFKALAHPARTGVLRVLGVGPATVADLCAATGLKPSHLAGHLTRLRAQQLITRTWPGGRLLYVLSCPEVTAMFAAAGLVLSVRSEARAVDPDHDQKGEASKGVPDADVRAKVEESVPFLERSLAARALVAEAVQSISARTGRSHNDALASLLAAAREREGTLVQVSLDVVTGDETG